MIAISVFQQWFLAILNIGVEAAAAMSLIAVLGLVAGRRGNGSFCLQGNLILLETAFWISLCGPIYYGLAWLFQVMAFGFGGDKIIRSIFTLASMPHVTSLLIWLAGMFCLYLALRSLTARLRAMTLSADRYRLGMIRLPLFLCLAASFCFFAVFVLVNWPFAGLPQEGLAWDRAIMAITRNASSHYFMAFCPAGALAIFLPLYFFDRLGLQATAAQTNIATRWLALWAAIGCLPHALQTWGLVLGLWLRGNLANNFGSMHAQIMALIFITIAIICWFWLLLDKKAPAWLAIIGLGMLILRQSSWLLARLFEL